MLQEDQGFREPSRTFWKEITAGVLSFILLAPLFFFSITPASAKEEKVRYRIATLFRLNDRYMHSDDTRLHIINGIDLAVETFRKRHPDVQVDLKHYSHGRELSDVKAKAELIGSKKYHLVIGGETSNQAIAMGEVFERQKIPYISPTATNLIVTKDKKFIFSVCSNDEQVAQKLARYVYEILKPEAIGILHNISYPYSDFLSSRFHQNLKEIGYKGKISAHKVLKDSTSLTKAVEAMKKDKVSHVTVFSYQDDLFEFLRQAEAKSFFPIYIGSDGWGRSTYIFDEMFKKHRHKRFRALQAAYWNGKTNTPLSKEFSSLHLKRFGKNANPFSAIGFDAAWVALNALHFSEDHTDGHDVAKTMEALDPIELITAKSFKFGAGHIADKEVHLDEISSSGINGLEIR